jgi:hypothetical protein
MCHPFDDQSQKRIKAEADAIKTILNRCLHVFYALASSPAIEIELMRIIPHGILPAYANENKVRPDSHCQQARLKLVSTISEVWNRVHAKILPRQEMGRESGYSELVNGAIAIKPAVG